MNYNEYDSNGNKKRFNIIDILSDRQKRSRFLLLIYLVFFILLVIIVRINIRDSLNNNNVENKSNNEKVIENKNTENIEKTDNPNDELNNMFSYIDSNNYEFKYIVNMKDSISIVEGKKYNEKYSFTLNNDGSILYFNGTKNYIKARETLDGEYKLTGFPYVLINYYDSNIIKEIIKNSNINNGVMEISNENIGKIINKDLPNKELLNTLEVYTKNNKITKIELNLTNAISSYINDSVTTKITLEFYNFGLVEDFNIE